MRRVLAVVALGLLGALALSGRAARDTPPPRSAVAAPTAPAAPSPPPRAALKLPREARGPVNADPTRRLAAFTNDSGVLIVDLLSGRTKRRIDIGVPPRLLAWTGKDRLVVARQNEIYELDARAGRVIRSRIAPGDVLAITRRGDGYVTVQARRGRAELHYGDERMPIPGMRASADVRRMIVPGLAVDGDTAYVIDAVRDRFAVVDMTAATVSVQSMGVARASKGLDMAVRHAAYLGEGQLAVSGERDLPSGEIIPYGLRLIDVNALRTIMLAPRQAELAAGRTRVVAWDIRGGGIAIYGRGGSRERRVLRGEHVYRVDVLGPYAHVQAFHPGGRRGRNFVVALATGKVLRGPRARASKTSARRSILGIAYPGGGQGRIAHYDPLTLRRVSRGAVVHGYMWGWDRAPGGGRVAVGVSNRGRIEIFDERNPRRARRIETGPREAVRNVRWVARDRLLALAGQSQSEALEIDVPSGRVVSRRAVGGQEFAVEATPDGLAVLTGPLDREGDAALLLLRAGEPPRRIALRGVRAAMYARVDVGPDDPPDLVPGLAVDGGVAYVAPTGPKRIVRVDLASGAVTTHALRAGAAKGGASHTRGLQVLGDGRLLLSGSDMAPNGRVERAFVDVVDTATWTTRALTDEGAGAVATPAGIVLPNYQERYVTVYAPDGRRLARHRPRYGVSALRIHGRYAYVGNNARSGRNHRTLVIDLRTGRRVNTLRTTTLPQLLTLSP
jgi:hypothetical protein